jgi:uncharacterized protein YsxB (DUF464 family)
MLLIYKRYSQKINPEEKVDLNVFGFTSNDSDSTTMKLQTRHQKTNAIEHLSFKPHSQKLSSYWDIVCTMFGMVGQNLITMIVFLLHSNPDVLSIIIHYLLLLRPHQTAAILHKQLYTFRDMNTSDSNSLAWTLRIKDEILLSDRSYFLLTNKLGLTKGILPCKTTVVNYRCSINKTIRDTFDLKVIKEQIEVTKKKKTEYVQSTGVWVDLLQITRKLKEIGKIDKPDVKLAYDEGCSGTVNVSLIDFTYL